MKSITALVPALAFLWVSPLESQGQQRFAISDDNVQIAYEVHGEGTTTLLFVHGWSCDRSYWNAQMKPFSRDFQVVALDLAGHGESGEDRDTYTIQAFGADVMAVAEKLKLKTIILIGHSMGGDVIAEAARLLKGRVAGLVMVDTYNQLKTPRTPEEVEKLTAPFRASFAEHTRSFVRSMFLPDSDPTLVERVSRDMSSAPERVALSGMKSALNYSREMPHTLTALRLPVVAINSDKDPTDVESMEVYNIEVIIMPGVGHFLMMEDPGRFNQLLTKAIGKLIK